MLGLVHTLRRLLWPAMRMSFVGLHTSTLDAFDRLRDVGLDGDLDPLR